MKIAVLASGALGFNNVLHFLKEFTFEFIATDSNSLEIIHLANENNIPLFIGNPRNRKLSKYFNNLKVDLILSINYIFIIEKDLIEMAQYIINFHGSLLPKYRGRTPHVWAIINNETKAGITAHVIDEGCDSGPIILQRIINIEPEMTGADLLKLYNSYYPDLISEVIRKYKNNDFILTPQDNKKASYFGKRTPEDGEINWNWQKERIKNWVRSQANPYPGAFTFLNKRKIVIDKISFSDLGFHQDYPDGLIIKINQQGIFIKTPNGVVRIDSLRVKDVLEFIKEGEVLGK